MTEEQAAVVTNNNIEVVDVTEDAEAGYDGDVEGQLPYQLEEAGSDNEGKSATATPTNEMTLVNSMQSLRCDTPEPKSSGLNASTRLSRKRAYAEITSDSDEEINEGVYSPPTVSKRQRKSTEARSEPLDTGFSNTELAESPFESKESDDVMEIDDISSALSTIA